MGTFQDRDGRYVAAISLSFDRLAAASGVGGDGGEGAVVVERVIVGLISWIREQAESDERDQEYDPLLILGPQLPPLRRGGGAAGRNKGPIPLAAVILVSTGDEDQEGGEGGDDARSVGSAGSGGSNHSSSSASSGGSSSSSASSGGAGRTIRGVCLIHARRRKGAGAGAGESASASRLAQVVYAVPESLLSVASVCSGLVASSRGYGGMAVDVPLGAITLLHDLGYHTANSNHMAGGDQAKGAEDDAEEEGVGAGAGDDGGDGDDGRAEEVAESDQEGDEFERAVGKLRAILREAEREKVPRGMDDESDEAESVMEPGQLFSMVIYW